MCNKCIWQLFFENDIIEVTKDLNKENSKKKRIIQIT